MPLRSRTLTPSPTSMHWRWSNAEPPDLYLGITEGRLALEPSSSHLDGRPNNKGEDRRKRYAMMYKIINNLVAIDPSPFLHLQNTATRGHFMRFLQPYCRTQTLRVSFFPTAIYIWNQLPATLVVTPTLEAFKTRVVTTSL